MNQKGFTLIEILVAIVIIVILSTLVIGTYLNSRGDTRDAATITQFKSIEKGLATFYTFYNVFPCGDSNTGFITADTNNSDGFLHGDIDGSGDAANNTQCDGEPRKGLQLIDAIPDFDESTIQHPSGSTWPWRYRYDVDVDRQTFYLYTILENNTEAMEGDGGKCDNYYEVGNGKVPESEGGMELRENKFAADGLGNLACIPS